MFFKSITCGTIFETNSSLPIRLLDPPLQYKSTISGILIKMAYIISLLLLSMSTGCRCVDTDFRRFIPGYIVTVSFTESLAYFYSRYIL